MKTTLAAALLTGAIAWAVPSHASRTPKEPFLRSGAARLSLPAGAGREAGMQIQADGAVFTQPAPLAVEVVDAAGATQWLTGPYQGVTSARGVLTGTGTLTSPGGTRFNVRDTYQALPRLGAFTLTRRVEVAAAGTDMGFSSRFSLAPARPTTMADCDFFAPGIWYRDNAHVPPGALASDPTDHYSFFREDRLPLPVLALRDKRDGETLTLAHLDGVPTTFADEDGLKRIIDARMQFGALGISNTDGPASTFLFPGTEGARTYIGGGSRQGNRWAYRSHPVRAGFSQQYRLLLQASRTPDFPAAVQQAWRTTYDLYAPPVISCDLAKVYRDGIALLATYTREYQGTISVPFAAQVPDGAVVDTSSQMGFVGQALPAAALLLKNGVESGDTGATARASEVVDFWARNCMTSAGVPRTWYDVHPDGHYTWRSYHTFLRVASDGMEGALQAWSVMRRHGRDRPEWLAFCRQYGDWLVGAQSADGSYAREYDFDGRPVNPAKDTTDQVIPFLGDLYRATDQERYKTAALRAGEFCWGAVHQAYAYVGGTPDNPNVMDKEGGMMALAAFLSLYDLTGDRRWLAAASQAAWYSETWVYCWNIPMPVDALKIVYPKNRTTYGLSLIATGHSGADDYMAAAPFQYYRLSLLTGEAHFRELARMLLYDTKQMLDWDGTLGYAHPGLLTEALSLPPPRGRGQTHWLPWLTVAILEPMARLQDVFGSMDIDEIERLPMAERRRRDARYAATHGFPPPGG